MKYSIHSGWSTVYIHESNCSCTSIPSEGTSFTIRPKQKTHSVHPLYNFFSLCNDPDQEMNTIVYKSIRSKTWKHMETSAFKERMLLLDIPLSLHSQTFAHQYLDLLNKAPVKRCSESNTLTLQCQVIQQVISRLSYFCSVAWHLPISWKWVHLTFYIQGNWCAHSCKWGLSRVRRCLKTNIDLLIALNGLRTIEHSKFCYWNTCVRRSTVLFGIVSNK